MSKIDIGFTPLEFEKEEKKLLEKLYEDVPSIKPEKPPVFLDVDKFQEAIKEVKKNIEEIQAGTSKLVSYAIYDKSSPALHSLKRLEDNPNISSVEIFLKIAKQDYGLNAQKEFERIFKDVFTEDPN